jgi:carboxymethylenebutenolidase
MTMREMRRERPLMTRQEMEVTLAAMAEDASVNHVPVTTGAKGKTALRAFYRDVFIGSWPDDLQMTTPNRVFG